jgi:hypothetical protein
MQTRRAAEDDRDCEDWFARCLAGTEIRVHAVATFGWLCIVTRPPRRAEPADLVRCGAVSSLWTMPDGITWPDARARKFAEAILDGGDGAIAFAYDNVADALRLQRRLREAAR